MYLRKFLSKAIIIFLLIGTQTKTNQIHAHNHYERLQCYLDGYSIDKNGNWLEEIPPLELQISYGAEYIIEKGNQSKYIVRKTLILSDKDAKKFGDNIDFNHDQIISDYKKNFNGNFEKTKFKNGKISYFDDFDNSNVILDLTNKTISRRNKPVDFGHKGSCRILSLKYPPQQAVNLTNLGIEYSKSLSKLYLSKKEEGEEALRMYREALSAFNSWSDTIYPEKMPVYRDFSFLYLLMGNQYHFTIKDDKLAAAEYSKAIESDPTYMYAHKMAAESYFASEQYIKAKEVLNSYLENWEVAVNKSIASRDAARGYFLRGVINGMLSKKKEACYDFKKAKLTNDKYRVKVDDILNDEELNPCS
tara:strand:+ start:1228 stop:2310 length:1083 start_codon:yes stop_codon:yes gene_type:complete